MLIKAVLLLGCRLFWGSGDNKANGADGSNEANGADGANEANGSNETNETNDTAKVTVYKPNMTVQKIANDNVTYVGNQTSFTIVVTNTGDCNLTDVVVTDTDFTKEIGSAYCRDRSREWA